MFSAVLDSKYTSSKGGLILLTLSETSKVTKPKAKAGAKAKDKEVTDAEKALKVVMGEQKKSSFRMRLFLQKIQILEVEGM